ncbi:MAG: 3-alpha-hydroxysteroid dehydrogenase, partial [Mycobacterium sp.]
MGHIDELWRYDGRRAVVTGCASGIGAHVVRQLTELGAHVVGLDKRPPSSDITE